MLSSMDPNFVMPGCHRPLGPLGPLAGVTLGYLRARLTRTMPAYFIDLTHTTATTTIAASSLVFIVNKYL